MIESVILILLDVGAGYVMGIYPWVYQMEGAIG